MVWTRHDPPALVSAAGREHFDELGTRKPSPVRQCRRSPRWE